MSRMRKTGKREQSIHKRLLSIILMFCLMLGSFTFGSGASTAYAADISASVLTDLTATITQDGAAIPEGGSITSTKPIRVEISFGVPVSGDDPTPTDPVQKGDTVTFNLSSAFTLLSGDTIELKMGTLLVGHATFTTDPITNMVTATVTFDGDNSVFDGTSNTVTCKFGANFEYDGSGTGGSTGDHTVTILEKTYTVNVPALPIEYDVTKKGTADLANQSITWTVNISATQGGAAVDLAGYQFFDDLQAVGTYIPSSFQVDSVDATPATADNALRYVFPDGATSPKTITFETKISDSAYYATSEQTVSNKAQLLNSESTAVDEGQFNVKFTPKWIEKTGVSSDAGSSGTYNPKDRTITWTITANHMGATLNNVVITDVLPSGLTLDTANTKWAKWNGSTWVDQGTITPDASGNYDIGDISSMILLTIVTNVPDQQYTTVTTTYTNSASIKWDGLTGPGLGSGGFGVTIGYNAMSKSGMADTANQKIRWTVNVDTKGQSIPDLKIYDLLVYGNSINLGAVTGLPSGITSTDLTPRYGQKYAGNFSGSYTVNVIPIMQGTTQVADLLEITGLSTTVLNTLSFDSQVVDPNIFAGNKTSTVRNTATLFSANVKLNAATGSVNYTNRMLLKGMLKREAMSDPASGVNSGLTSNAPEGFDYQDKSAIFRLNVNADGINLTGATNAAGQTLGTATLTDTLPDGWEFVDIVSGSKYLIFEGVGQSNGTVLATDTTPDTVAGLDASFNGRTATFTFSSLDQPYVILVKARPTSDTAAGYFDSNETTTVRNNATLNTENWITGVSSYQDVTITSQILSKTTVQPTTGELRWTVDCKPYDLAQLGEKLEDQLPVGIDLRTDSSGALLLDGNITANEMTLNADGSYTVGSPVTLELGTNVSYDNATRVLSFIIPDNTKAYRFSYITDITGEPGTVTNKVSLLGSSMEQEETSKPYVITASDGSASLLRNGWISITKTDGVGVPLAGAEFTLYAMDGTTVIKKGVTGSDGAVKLKVIPDGEYILRETAVPAGYTLEGVTHSLLVTTSGSTVTASIDGKTGTNSNVITIQNFSEDTAGNLTISKAVAGDGADITKSFDFTLTLNGATGTYTYIGHGMPGGIIASGDTISLTHGQSITIVGLPKGATYTVTEADYSGDGYTPTSTGAAGSIVADATQTASFTNTRTVGNLTISKTVAGNAGDTSKKFDFRLTLNGAADIPYAYTGDGVPDGTIKSGDNVSLAHGQSITITGLPAGTTYTVTESDYSDGGYTMSSTGATGSIVTDTTQAASFTNTRNVSNPSPDTGNLTISKTVAGVGADTAKKFNFTVTFSVASASYHYTGNGVPDGTIKSGDTISLAHGQSITITGLPAGATYHVTEETASAQGYSVESAGSSGTISSSQDRTAAFTNTKLPISTGSLSISKTVTGEGADLTKKFTFTVTFIGASDAYPYIGAATGTIRSGDSISLAGGESITITGLPEGTQYTVTEADYTGAGYTSTSTGAAGTISADTLQTASFTNDLSSAPGKPGTPGNPADNIGDGDTPQGSVNGGESSMPKTGDSQAGSLAKLGLLFFSAALVALSTADIALRKKYSRKRNRK
jgi:ribosomal protein L2